MKNPKLVDLDKLRKLIAALDLSDKKWNEYIEARWLNYVEWWDSRARTAKRKYFFLRCAVVIAGALIPALVGLRSWRSSAITRGRSPLLQLWRASW